MQFCVDASLCAWAQPAHLDLTLPISIIYVIVTLGVAVDLLWLLSISLEESVCGGTLNTKVLNSEPVVHAVKISHHIKESKPFTTLS